MKISELAPRELAILDQILHFLAAYNLEMVNEPEKLKVEKAANFDFERLKNYCLEIGITLKVFNPKNAQAGFIYFQPWPTNNHEVGGVDQLDFSQFYESYLRRTGRPSA